MYCVLTFIILIFCASDITSDSIPFLPCGNLKTVSSFHITPCNGSFIDDWWTCRLMHGIQATFEAGFVTPFDSSSLQTEMSITIDGLETPTLNSGYDPCYGSILPECPVKQGRPYIFSREYSVQGEFPVGTTALKLLIRDMVTKEVATCGKIPIVVNPNPAYFYEN